MFTHYGSVYFSFSLSTTPIAITNHLIQRCFLAQDLGQAEVPDIGMCIFGMERERLYRVSQYMWDTLHC